MFYKISDKDLNQARNKDPMTALACVGDVTYYHTEEDLQPPFIKVDEKDVPFGEGLDLSYRRKMLVDREHAKIHFDFTSNALGSEHKYDLHDEKDQANLVQALLYIQINSGIMNNSLTANVRCVDENGVKSNRPHTRKQLEKLYSDWYTFKSSILDRYSDVKIEVNTNNPLVLKKLEEN